MKGANFLVIRSCNEFEPEWLRVLEDRHDKPVILVGQLPTIGKNDADETMDVAWRSMKEWLDKQEKGSVVYIAFGSEAKPNQVDLNEIVQGLELSGFPFFWVLRNKRGGADTEIVALPEEFEDRTKGRGIVRTSSAPQLKILSHESLGGFLTHSGWSSEVEAIRCKLALILLTFFADQGLNARVLEAKKTGYSIPIDDQDESFTREPVAESLRLVLMEEEERIYREKIKEMKGLFCDEARQDQYVDNLFGYLLSSKGVKHGKF